MADGQDLGPLAITIGDRFPAAGMRKTWNKESNGDTKLGG